MALSYNFFTKMFLSSPDFLLGILTEIVQHFGIFLAIFRLVIFLIFPNATCQQAKQVSLAKLWMVEKIFPQLASYVSFRVVRVGSSLDFDRPLQCRHQVFLEIMKTGRFPCLFLRDSCIFGADMGLVSFALCTFALSLILSGLLDKKRWGSGI